MEQQAEITGLKADQTKSIATIQSLTEERDRLQGDKEQLVSRVVQGAGTVVDTVATLSRQVERKAKEVEELSRRNTQLTAQVAELAKPKQTLSPYLQKPKPGP